MGGILSFLPKERHSIKKTNIKVVSIRHFGSEKVFESRVTVSRRWTISHQSMKWANFEIGNILVQKVLSIQIYFDILYLYQFLGTVSDQLVESGVTVRVGRSCARQS